MKKKKAKPTKTKKKAAKPKAKAKASKAKAKKKAGDYHVYEHREYTEREVVQNLNEDFSDAWYKLREFASGLGPQRIYASAKAIMFSRKVCYLFIRPQRKYIEVCFFTGGPIKSAQLKSESRSKTKIGHVFRLVHPDQVEEPLTDWIREAYEFCLPAPNETDAPAEPVEDRDDAYSAVHFSE